MTGRFAVAAGGLGFGLTFFAEERLRFQTVRGTHDILPGQIEAWQRVEALARDVFERYGYREIRTPILEATELFARGVGSSTDIVRKEMYTFTSGDDSVTLRPEMTASVVRAYVQHGLWKSGGAERYYYIGPMFRHERPQKGRQRQFHQIGVEALGSEDPYVDAEAIEMVMSFLAKSRVGSLVLVLNSVGCPTCRPAYRDALARWLDRPADASEPGSSAAAAQSHATQPARRERLCADCQRRLVENPLRVFDCKVEADRLLLRDAPTMLDHLCEACRGHFTAVQDHLRRLEIAFRIDPRLVRGLDYYVRTAFEIVAEEGLGSQNSLMGGGRYDGLVKELGGPDVPGFGWALGVERLLMLRETATGPTGEKEEAAGAPPSPAHGPDVFIAHLGDDAWSRAILLARTLRGCGYTVRVDPSPGKLGAQLKRADREGARFALIFGEDEIRQSIYQLKNMQTQVQEPVEAAEPAALVERLAALIGLPRSRRADRGSATGDIPC